MKKIIFTILFLLLSAATVIADDITFAWLPSESPDIVEYRIYQSLLPRQHALGNGNEVLSVAGNTYKATIVDVSPGRYYWVVTAVNNSGIESPPSNEVGLTVGGTDHDAQNTGMDQWASVVESSPLLTIIEIK